MKTGVDVQKLGLYASDCCMQETLFDANECFSRCPQCTNLCEWELVDIESSSKDIRVLKEKVSIGRLWTRRPNFTTGAFRYSY